VAFAAALVPIAPTPLQLRELPPAPSFITDGVWREYATAGRSVVPVPVPSNKAMLGQTWSAETLTEMPIPAGYFLGPTSDTDPQGHWGPPPRPTAQLLNDIAVSGRIPTLTEADRRSLLEDLRFWRASVVVLGEHAHGEQLRAALEELLGPGTRRADVWLWDVRALVDAE
jgi:hypothetical protein